MAKAISEREKEKLPSTSQVNPKECVMAISFRSKKELEEPSVGEKPQVEKGNKVMIDCERENCEKKGAKLEEKPAHQKEVKPYVPHIP